MAQHSDFGNQINSAFKKRDKKKDFILRVESVGGNVHVIKIVAADNDSFSGFQGNKASAGFSAEKRVYNPEQIFSFTVLQQEDRNA